MKRTTKYLVIGVFLFMSCKPDHSKNIIGDWFLEDGKVFTGIEKYEKTEYIEPKEIHEFYYVPKGYSFKENGIVEKFEGFWKCTDSGKCYFTSNIGNYTITDDSLIITEKNSLILKYKILNSTKDSLVLSRDTKKESFYYRFDYDTKCSEKIDSIVLEYHSSWGYKEAYTINTKNGYSHYNRSIKNFTNDI